MEKSFVSKSFFPRNFSDADLLTKANTVLSGMTNNEHFPDLQSKLIKLKADTENYSTSLSNNFDGGKRETIMKNNDRIILESALKELAVHVELTSKNEASIILSSGFDLKKAKTRVGMLDKPVNFKAKTSDLKGSIILFCQVIPHTKMYLFEYTLDPVDLNSVWTQVNSSGHKKMIQHLQSGKLYSFRVAALGTHPDFVWSDVITSYVI